MVPLVILFELSIVLASVFGRPRERQATASPSPERSG
jgi:Sec-independent protein secretion pathway component TatC